MLQERNRGGMDLAEIVKRVEYDDLIPAFTDALQRPAPEKARSLREQYNLVYEAIKRDGRVHRDAETYLDACRLTMELVSALDELSSITGRSEIMRCPQCGTSDDDFIVYDHYESGNYDVGYCTRCQVFYRSIYGLIGGSMHEQEPFPFKSTKCDEFCRLLLKESAVSELAKRQVLHALLKDLKGAVITDFTIETVCHVAGYAITLVKLMLYSEEVGCADIVIEQGHELAPSRRVRRVLKITTEKHGTVYI